MRGKKFISLVLMICFLTPAPAVRSQVRKPGETGPVYPGMGMETPTAPGGGVTAPGAVPTAPGMAPGAPGVAGQTGTATDLPSQAQFYLQRMSPTLGAPEIQQVVPGQIPAKPVPPQPPAPGLGPTQEVLPPIKIEEPTELELRAKTQGLNISLFGYDFFQRAPANFLPVTQVPVGPDYLIGPGDTVRIILWGSIQGEFTLPVDRNGQIAVPKVGVVHVSGLNYRQLREVLDREFARQFTNFQMNVTLDNLRAITVFVVGQARFPGSYTVSSLSTLVSALFASGGPSKQGSMRGVEVRRGGRTVVRFDLYDFLLRGDKSKDIRLMPEDVIFIPVVGERVGIGGPVKVPAIYELRQECTLSDLIHLAGGLAPTAFKSRVQMLRVKNRKEMVLVEDDLELFLSGQRQDISLAGGDLVKIFPVSSQDIHVVRISGAVQNPGEFGFKSGMRVSDLILYANGFLISSNQDEAEITRVAPTPQGPLTTRLIINLRLAMAGNSKENIVLRPNDYLFVRNVPGWDLYKIMQLNGELRYPGKYTIKKGETLSSVLTRAGGFADNAYPKGAFFTREAVKQEQTKHLKQAVDRIEAEMLAVTSAQTQTELDPKEAQRMTTVYQQQRQLIAKLREITPLGRVVVRLDDPERLRGTPWDIELQEGDNLFVPQVPTDGKCLRFGGQSHGHYL